MGITEDTALTIKQRKEARLYELEVERKQKADIAHQAVRRINQIDAEIKALEDEAVIDEIL